MYWRYAGMARDIHTGMGNSAVQLMDEISKFGLLQGGMDIVPVRLKNAVLRIVARSKHRAYYLPQREQQPGATTPTHVRALSLHCLMYYKL